MISPSPFTLCTRCSLGRPGLHRVSQMLGLLIFWKETNIFSEHLVAELPPSLTALHRSLPNRWLQKSPFKIGQREDGPEDKSIEFKFNCVFWKLLQPERISGFLFCNHEQISWISKHPFRRPDSRTDGLMHIESEKYPRSAVGGDRVWLDSACPRTPSSYFWLSSRLDRTGLANAKQARVCKQTLSKEAKMFFFLKEKVCTSSWYKYTYTLTENLYYLSLGIFFKTA